MRRENKKEPVEQPHDVRLNADEPKISNLKNLSFKYSWPSNILYSKTSFELNRSIDSCPIISLYKVISDILRFRDISAQSFWLIHTSSQTGSLATGLVVDLIVEYDF